jgi:hypothetical protein
MTLDRLGLLIGHRLCVGTEAAAADLRNTRRAVGSKDKTKEL